MKLAASNIPRYRHSLAGLIEKLRRPPSSSTRAQSPDRFDREKRGDQSLTPRRDAKRRAVHDDVAAAQQRLETALQEVPTRESIVQRLAGQRAPALQQEDDGLNRERIRDDVIQRRVEDQEAAHR